MQYGRSALTSCQTADFGSVAETYTPEVPWGRARMWFSIFGRWLATSVVATATLFISAGYFNNLDDEAPGDAWFGGSDSDVIMIGVILAVIFGGGLGIVSGVVPATIGAIFLVPYKGKRASFALAIGLGTGIAATVTGLVLAKRPARA